MEGPYCTFHLFVT